MLGIVVPVPIYIDKELIQNIDPQILLIFILISVIMLIIILGIEQGDE